MDSKINDARLIKGKFDEKQFLRFRDFINQNFGIYYADVKRELLRMKIEKCLLKSGVNSFDDYYKLISENNDGTYLTHFIDEITVNKTDFFREREHFDFIKENKELVLNSNPSILRKNEIRVWSMACSTGQEAYTLAMVLKETFPSITIKVLATDISCRVLKYAIEGIYPNSVKNEMEPYYLNKYFVFSNGLLEVKRQLKQLVTFRQFNLMNEFPFKGKFDIIFCRNVMIYFDLQTQQHLLAKMNDCLSTGGLLFLGLSESLLNKNNSFRNLKSSIHIK